jgi:diguanylate cyclase (GGDEF)-like protein
MRVGIRLRLLGAFASLGAVTLVLGLWAVWEVTNLAGIEARTFDRPMMATTYIHAAATKFEQITNPTLADTRAREAAEGDNAIKTLFDEIAVARKRSSSRPATVAIDKAAADARVYLDQPTLANAARARVAFDLAGEQVLDDGFMDRAAAKQAETRAKHLGPIAVIAAILLSASLAIVLAARFLKPIRIATSIADQIAAGDLSVAIPRNRRDEIGTLMDALDAMQSRIRSMIVAEQTRAQVVENRLESMLASSTEAMILLDADDCFMDANAAARAILAGLGATLVVGVEFNALFPIPTWAPLLRRPVELQLPDGIWLAPSWHGVPTGGGFLSLTNITLRKQAEARLETLAFRDPLTGLRNRSFLSAHLEREDAINRGDALLLANLDRFRLINNLYGTAVGDAVIVEIARRLSAETGPNDICARINGDEFALLLHNPSAEHLVSVTNALAGSCANAIQIGLSKVSVTIRIGLTRAGTNSNGDTLLHEARAALDHARRKGQGMTVTYDGTLRAAARIRTLIDRDLPLAIEERIITLDYQPLVSLATGAVVGVEALARWHHPELGKIPPIQFITAAEESDAIIGLGRLVLAKATTWAIDWVKRWPGTFTVAVNLSPRQLIDPHAATEILAFLDQHAAIASSLKFEITESVLMDDPEKMLVLLRTFKARGVQLALDDFGTGFSSLSYLHKFPFDILKIDQSFVRDIDRNPDAHRLVQTIIELGRDLGLTLVAEGVETTEQAALLRHLGAHIGQGYLFARPMPPEKISDFVSRCEPINANVLSVCQ